MHTTIVVNYAAASGRAEAIWRTAAAGAVGLENACLVAASAPADARRALVEQLRAGTERVIVVGGDGSVHLAANAILTEGCGGRVDLGIIPAGTGSDLARSLGLARDPRSGLERILNGQARHIDVLEMRTDDGRTCFVINVASAGLSGLVDEMVNAMPQRGALAYLSATLRALGRYEPACCRVIVDGQPWFEGRVFLLAVANGATFGRGMQIAPRAVLDDGLAEVVVIPAIGTLRLLLRLPQVYRGTHLANGEVHYCRGREIRLEPLERLPPFDLDGETFASAPAVWSVRCGALRVIG